MPNLYRIETLGDKVIDDLPLFLSKDKQTVTASKISGLLGVSNMLSYAVKYAVEARLPGLKQEVEKDAGHKFADYLEMDEWLEKEYPDKPAEAERLNSQPATA